MHFVSVIRHKDPMKRNQKIQASAAAAEEHAALLPPGPVSVKFTCPRFQHENVVYNSQDVESLAKKGDEKALRIIAELVNLRSGVIEFEELPADDLQTAKTTESVNAKSPEPEAPKEEAKEEGGTNQ